MPHPCSHSRGCRSRQCRGAVKVRDGASPFLARLLSVGFAAAPVTAPAQGAAAAPGMAETEAAAALGPALGGGRGR